LVDMNCFSFSLSSKVFISPLRLKYNFADKVFSVVCCNVGFFFSVHVYLELKIPPVHGCLYCYIESGDFSTMLFIDFPWLYFVFQLVLLPCKCLGLAFSLCLRVLICCIHVSYFFFMIFCMQ
jgi:hypothetical protein